MNLHPSSVCGNCGSPLSPSARFCDKCGRPVGAVAMNPQPDLAGGSVRGGKGWWVCGSLAVVAVIGVVCLAGVGLLFWTETIPTPAFLESNPEPEVVVIPTLVISPSASVSEQIPETPAPAGTEEAAAPQENISVPAPDFEYQGVSLTFDDSLTINLKGTTIPAVSDPANAPPWELMPEYINLEMAGYPLKDTFHEPRIMIFPLEEYYALTDSARETAESLRKVITARQVSPDQDIPFLPQWNAAQVFHAAAKFIDFSGGSGVRFLTQYGQNIAPINNNAIFYCFQGLTSDGKYYISAILPVFDPLLPMDGSEIPGGDYQAFSDGYPDYIQKTVAELEEQQDQIFFPDLKLLDEMMASIEIKSP